MIHTSIFFSFLFRASSTAHESSQARGRIKAIAAGLRHSSQQRQILNPLSEARDRIRNLMDTGWVCNVLSHGRSSLILLICFTKPLPRVSLAPRVVCVHTRPPCKLRAGAAFPISVSCLHRPQEGRGSTKTDSLQIQFPLRPPKNYMHLYLRTQEEERAVETDCQPGT